MNIDINFDFERRERIGFVEAIWGADKSIDQLKRVSLEVLNKKEVVFITRISKHKAKHLLGIHKNAKFNEEAKCLIIGENLKKISTNKKVAIISGGSSDLAVTLEAKLTLEIYGIVCKSFIDVGVAGLHRLFNQIEEIKKYDVLIVCAGMEGALATVIGGLLPQPIIAVPVSVGYGVSKNGETALRSMLSSCSPGISVMNIDNGYGAAIAALRIIKSSS
ncbi:nickel pincer cofactor biosynthesis protein LarB [Prochlorococcus marinus XMU1411]|uniref:nickel pincer cofactor biosynthesis protein LarB n=1 Tax=Prochlorococcus marinus TaxID=1219 RepID=UPI001AD96A8C|nr:nickel pincer cofactor biosynthesis protein LarB [Prochlorococcus marinus]MBO8244266.1 nickel pincer cofactor biosynthesis protein LarB [Prochlorococcus marinus XMU1411]MBW3055351.1 circadian phase modifier CpmA [Prochlorococcus marinus str. MU1411]MCR8537094.1 nickel pincer cofactor biosynthesis protein LarB [Prochlorococcus marinus CUG1430]